MKPIRQHNPTTRELIEPIIQPDARLRAAVISLLNSRSLEYDYGIKPNLMDVGNEGIRLATLRGSVVDNNASVKLANRIYRLHRLSPTFNTLLL